MAIIGQGVTSGRGGGITVIFEPPVEFILKQAGAFQRELILDMEALWEGFKPVMGALEQLQFSSSGRGEWPPLAESTVKRKGHGTILVDTGALKASITDPNTAMQIHGVEAEYGTDVEYAHWHQDGGFVAGRPPVRQIIPDPFPVETRRELEKVMVTWIDRIAARTFGRI